jgi:hypothetical protein
VLGADPALQAKPDSWVARRPLRPTPWPDVARPMCSCYSECCMPEHPPMQMRMPACWLVGVVVGVLMLMLMLPMLPAREGPAGSCCSFLPCTAPSPPLTRRVCFASHSQLGTGAAATAGAGPGDSRGGPAHSVHWMWGCLVRETEWLNTTSDCQNLPCTTCVCAAGCASLGLASPGITSHHITWHRIASHLPYLGSQPRARSSHGTLCSLRLLAARCATAGRR